MLWLSCPGILPWLKPIHMIWALRHKVAGWRLFDHQKETVMPGFFTVLPGFFFDFFHFLLLFVTFFTACNFCKLLFIIEGSLFVTFFYCL
jgi:hypothetical protein